MLITLDVVQDENQPVTRWQLSNGAFQGKPVNGPRQVQIGSAKLNIQYVSGSSPRSTLS